MANIIRFGGHEVGRALGLAALTIAQGLLMLSPARAQAPTPWSFFGGDVSNTRANLSTGTNVTSPTQINPKTAPKLALKWSFSTVGDVSATPTVEAGGLYVPDYAGNLYKLNPVTGKQIWMHPLSYYTGSYAYSRSAPAIGAMGEIVVGINSSSSSGAHVLSINRTTGAKIWEATVDTTTHSYVTASPVIYNKLVYIGVAANEEELVASQAGFKPSFRGSVVALNEATGAVVWRFTTVPTGYTGASVWGGNPVVWTPGNALLFGTGNNVSVPSSVSACLQSKGAQQQSCLDPTDYVDSIVSVNLATGKVNWARRMEVDTWTSGCSDGPASACPTPAGKDDDFASAPNMVYLSNFVGVADDRGGTSKNYLLGAGQKSAYYRGLNPYNGGLFWATHLGQGQIIWGSAINMGVRNAAYVGLSGRYKNTLAGQNGVKVTSSGGSWASVNLFTGALNWQVPTLGADLGSPGFTGSATGPVSYTNRVMLAGSTSGIMVALDSSSGNKLWSFNAGGSIIGGASIYNETVYFGAGAQRSGNGTVHKVFAFAVPAT